MQNHPNYEALSGCTLSLTFSTLAVPYGEDIFIFYPKDIIMSYYYMNPKVERAIRMDSYGFLYQFPM